MARRDFTFIGGENESFESTQWGEIIRVRDGDDPTRERAIARILGQYWKPVYCYLRRKGYANDKAKDLTQGFFCDVVLGRRLIERADPRKGKFRTFLLTALNNYAVSIARAEQANKRMPTEGLVALDGDDGPVPEPRGDVSPEEAFHCAWAASLIESVLADVERRCLADGLDRHWQVFRAMVVEPILHGESSPRLEALCEELGIASRTKAYNMNVTVKRRFQAGLAERVRQYAGSDAEVNEEIGEIMAALSHRPAG